MYITNTNTATRRLFDATLTDADGEQLMQQSVEFEKTGTAQVTRELGEALVEKYDSIEAKETET